MSYSRREFCAAAGTAVGALAASSAKGANDRIQFGSIGVGGMGTGLIGNVTWAQGSYNRDGRVCLFNEHHKMEPTGGPDKGGEDHIDWDMWLGHEWGLAPKRPWTPEHFFRFPKYWQYNGGVATY